MREKRRMSEGIKNEKKRIKARRGKKGKGRNRKEKRK